MRILAISSGTAKATPEIIAREMPGEIAVGKQLFAQGIIIEGYMDPSYTDAYLLMECASVAEAEAACATYPLVETGAITFRFIPLIGLPAISQLQGERGLPLPAWWPAAESKDKL